VPGSLPLTLLVDVSAQVAATRKRLEKRRLLAAILRSAPPEERGLVVAFLMGVVPHGPLGVGYAALSGVDAAPVDDPVLGLADIDEAFCELAETAGPGSQERRRRILERIYARTDRPGQRFLTGLIGGELRQGAQEGLMADAVAEAFDVEPAAVRRAAMFAGDLVPVALAASEGGQSAVEAFGLELFTPVQPMLAQSAASVTEALEKIGPAAVEWKFDGARLQIHRNDDRVALYTRNLRDITGQLPGVVERIRKLPARTMILDAEVMAFGATGRPEPFQETMGRFGTQEAVDKGLDLFVFDALHFDGVDLVDLPDSERRSRLETIIPADLLVPRLATDDPEAGEAFFEDAIATGHEGVMVKALAGTYEAGRRGSAWIKVKPVHTLDLVVLAVEWGSGRRSGWLSNIHLGARDPDSGGFVMLGKTFKGMTDEMLEWQTARFLELEERRTPRTVWVRPEQVVEIAFDGVQASTRYPGGMALRFARVKQYRDDKSAEEADTLDTVRTFFERSRSKPEAQGDE
jgi:DNA ligase-1